MSNDKGFDFRQILTFKKKRHASLIIFIIVLIVFGITKVSVGFIISQREEDAKPKLALNTLISDLRQYQSEKRRFPLSFTDLKKEVWDKQNSPGKRSLIGARYFSEDNYVYFYSSDEKFCSVWAVPQGKYKDSGETIYILLSNTSQEGWRGRALSEEQKRMIPAVVRPPLALMAQFNLTKDSAEENGQKGGGWFDSLFKGFKR